jgi:Protein of unknown function (DUF1236)
MTLQFFWENAMKSRTWIGAAAAAGLATVAATGFAVAQERQPGQAQAPAGQQTENGHHRGEAAGQGAMERGALQKGERAQSAQAQSPREERLRHEGAGQEKMGQEKSGQEGMKPGEQGKAAQGANQAQTEKMNGEHRAGQENQTHAQGTQNNRENNAATRQQTGQANQPGEAEKGKAGEQTGQALENKNRAGETEKGKTAAEGQTPRAEMQSNRQGEGQSAENAQHERNAQGGGGERHVSPQNVRIEGNAHLSNDRAARIADTLLATSASEHVNVNVRVGEPLPGDVRLMPLPPTIVDLAPEFRDYDYFVANDEIVIVQPSTRHVVEVINTGGGEQAMATTRVNPCGP